VSVTRIAVLLALAAPAVAPAASAETIRLNWREDDGVGAMRFTVSTLTLSGDRWSARVSFTNDSGVPLGIERRFALLVYGSRNVRAPHVQLRATAFAPAMPRSLPPRRTWSGVWRGRGTPPRGSYLRLLFGRFSADPSPIPGQTRFSWVTEHVHRRATRA
jgi:hypothetical protein